jgi:putative salt-induced outer membrane protein
VNRNLGPLYQLAGDVFAGNPDRFSRDSQTAFFSDTPLYRSSPGRVLHFVLLIAAFAFGASAWSAESVTLYLKNGDRVTGTISSQDTNRVVLTTPWAKEVIIPADQISKREPVPVVVKAPPPKPSPAAGAGATAGMASPPLRKPAHLWTGELNVGTDLGFSEKNRQLYTARAKVIFAYERFKNTFDYDFSYGRTDGILSANRMEGFSKGDVDLGRRWYVYNIGGAGYDEIRKIDIRYELGPGVGYHLVKSSNFVLNTELGMNYQEQRFANDGKTDLFFYRLGEIANWQLNSKVTFDEKFEFFPRVEDIEEFRLRFESNLRYWMRSNLSLNLTVIDLYDTQPAPTVTRNDLQVRSSVGVKF